MDQDSKYIMKSASRMKIRSNTSPIDYTRSFSESSTSVFSMILHELLGAKGSKGRMASSSNGKSLTGSLFKTEHVCSATSDFLSPFPPLFAGSSSASPMTSGNVTTEKKSPKFHPSSMTQSFLQRNRCNETVCRLV